jgi:Ca2+-transporting ATPase
MYLLSANLGEIGLLVVASVAGQPLPLSVVALIATGGAWSAAVTSSLFIWAANSGRELEKAMTMTFVTLVLIEFFKAYAYRSERESVLRSPFANRWLNLAVLWELGLLALVLYLPFLHGPFDTVGLSVDDWAIVLACAATVLPVLEAAKWLVRRGVLDPQ